MKKNYIYNLLLSIVNILFPIISFPYASRILGPVGIGKVQLVSSFAQYFALIAALGIPVYGIQEIAKAKDNKQKLAGVFSELMVIYFITSIVLSAIYLAIIFAFPYFKINLELYSFAVLFILLGFSSIEWFYSGLEEFRGIAIRSVSIKLLSLLFLYLFVKDAADFKYYLFITMFAVLGNNLVSLLMVGRKTSMRFTNLDMKKHFTPLFFIFSTTIAASMNTLLDTVILGFLSNDQSVGLYTASVKFTKVALQFVISIGVILIPRIAKNFSEGKLDKVQELIDKSFHFIIFFSIPILAGLAMLAPEFITVFSGIKFLDATVCMRILSLLPVLIGMGYFFAFQILVPAGKNKEMFLSVIGGVATSLLLNFLLVPVMKEIGAAIANVSSELVVTMLYFYFVRKYYSFRYNWALIWRAVLCTLLFIPVIIIIHSMKMNIFLTLFTSVGCCTLVYTFAQYFLFKDYFMFRIIEMVYTRLRVKKEPLEL